MPDNLHGRTPCDWPQAHVHNLVGKYEQPDGGHGPCRARGAKEATRLSLPRLPGPGAVAIIRCSRRGSRARTWAHGGVVVKWGTV